MEQIDAHRCFGGSQLRYRHWAESLGCTMTLSVFLPPQAGSRRAVPVLYWLSGLTCTDENFVLKAGAQRYAAEYGLALVAPDTSPRGQGVPDDAEGAFDLGLGAGFYVNATAPPWCDHYRMYDYVVEELPALLGRSLPLDTSRAGISGHSMGGHGALVAALRNPARYRSVSAFAPICNPMACPWGQKAFTAYLGPDPREWEAWDATALLRRAPPALPLLVDQGDQDGYLQEQLRPDALASAAAAAGWPLDLRMRQGYDHSYFFIASFIGEHLAFHARHL